MAARARNRLAGQLGATVSELMVGVVTASAVGALSVGVYGRMAQASERARRAAELDARLAAAESVLARDVRQDGYRLDELAPVKGLAEATLARDGEIVAAWVDDSVQTTIRAAQADHPSDAVTVDAPGGFAPGDWVIAGSATGGCLGSVQEVGSAWLRLATVDACEPASGRWLARLVVHRYRAENGALWVADGPAPWRAVVQGVSRLAVAPAGELVTLSLETTDEDAGGSGLSRTATATVHPRNRTSR